MAGDFIDIFADQRPKTSFNPGSALPPEWAQFYKTAIDRVNQDPGGMGNWYDEHNQPYYDPVTKYLTVPDPSDPHSGRFRVIPDAEAYLGPREAKGPAFNGKPAYWYDDKGNFLRQSVEANWGEGHLNPLVGALGIMALPFAASAAGLGAAGAGAAGASTAPVLGSTGALTGAELGTLGAGVSGAAPSLTGLGMTGTIPAGMGYGSGLTTGLAGYGGLGAGAGYGATFAGSMEALGAAAAAGAAGGMGGAEVLDFGDVMNLPGHELTHAAGEIGGLSGAASGLGSLLGNSGSGFNWGSLIGPGLSAIGGIYGANAASNAADAQLQAAREAQAKLEPWYQKGELALNALATELGLGTNTGAPNFGRSARDFGAADFQADPGYAFRQSEQQKGLERAASAQGGIGSGKFLKDAMSYSGGLASQEYNNAFNRFQTARTNRLNPLQSLAGQGQSTAQMVGDLSTQAGNAAAAGKVGQANALTNAIGQGYSMYQNSQQQDQNNQLMNILLRRGV